MINLPSSQSNDRYSRIGSTALLYHLPGSFAPLFPSCGPASMLRARVPSLLFHRTDMGGRSERDTSLAAKDHRRRESQNLTSCQVTLKVSKSNPHRVVALVL